MKWFSKHRVCTDCGVHFEPHADRINAARWPDLCHAHLQPHRELFDREARVASWARLNWTSLEPQMLAEQDGQVAKQREAMEACARNLQAGLSRQQYMSEQQARQSGPLGNLGAAFGVGP